MASTYLSKNLPNNDNSLHKWTYSGWIKKSEIPTGSNETYFVQWYNDASNRGGIRFDGDGAITAYERYGGTTVYAQTTSRKCRDTNAWYHIVWSVDKSLSTPVTKIYVNGVEETSFATSIAYSQNQTGVINNTGNLYINSYDGASYIYNQLQAHVHWISGTVYTASDFGEFDSNGVWKPKTSPSVTYGTNGFFLKFENSGSMGTDSSGNGNNFTVNGSLTQTLDTPSNVYATLNPLDGNYNNQGVPSLSTGNLVNTDSAGYKPAFGTLAVSKGKWYYEYRFAGTPDSWVFGGWGNSLVGGSSLSVYRNSNGDLFDGSNYNAYGASYSAGDIIGVAFDYDNDQITFYKNGVSQGTATSLGINTDLSFPMVGVVSTGASIDVNFGNGYFGTTAVSSAGSNGNGAIFEYDVPSGYYALNTKNLATYG